MAYGIQVFSNSGGIQLDTTKSIRDYVPVAIGTANNVGTSSIPVVPVTDLVFVRIPVDYGQQKQIYKLFVNSYNMQFYVQTNQSASSASGGVLTSLDYIHCKPIENVSSSSSTYGIRTFDASSSVTYDSSKYTQPGGFSLVAYANPMTQNGNPAAQGTPITSDITKYVDIANTTLQGGIANKVMVSSSHSTYGTGIWHVGWINVFTIQYINNIYSHLIGEKFL